MITSSRMIKYLALPLILVGCTAPVTDPPAHACSPRLDGKPTYCPDERDLIFLKREEPKGEIDVTCLLYTSPSPRDRTRSRMPSSA